MVIVVDSKLIAYNIGYNPNRSMIDVMGVVQNICEDLEWERNDKVSRVVFMFDFEKSDYRLGLWHAYKGNRKYKDIAEDFQENYRHRLPDLAQALGIDVLGVSGVEADDLAGILIKNYKGSENIVCITGDRDWVQLSLEHEHVTVYDPKQLKYLGTACNTVDEFLVEKVVKGDSSDNIKGLMLCGKKCWDEFHSRLDDRPIKEQFLELVESNKTFYVHKDYEAISIQSFEELYDFNLQLGRIMTNMSLLTSLQQEEYRAALAEFRNDHRLDTAGIQKLAGEISGNRLGIFGDPLVVPDHQLEFYRRFKDG